MATTSVVFITLLVITSLSMRAESYPHGCKKMVGPLEDAIPGEYIVKMLRGTKTHTIVKMMLEMATSGCEGKVHRASNSSDAPMQPMTTSSMIYIERIGFAAKMSDAAVMWLCDKDSVDYIEPVGRVTLPTQPPTTPTEEIGSGASPGTEVVPENVQPTTTTTGGAETSQVDGSGDMTEVVPVATSYPTVDPTAPTTVTCTKLRGDLLPVNDYLIMFQHDLPAPRMNELYNLLESIKKVDENFDNSKMKVIFRGPVKGFYYNGLNREAIMKLCESDLVDYIQVQEDSSSTPTPQPTATSTPGVNPTPVTSPVTCNKLVEYEDESAIVPDRYIVILKKYTSQNDIIKLVTQLKEMMTTDTHISITINEVILAENMKMITVETNKAGLAWICENSHVEKIDHDKVMMITNPSTSEESSDASSTVTPQPTSMPTPTSTPAACDKMVRYDDKTGIIPNRYVLMLNKHTSQSDIIELVKQLKDLMTTVEENTIKVKEIILAENIKMITVEINQAGLEWICQNPHVEKIDHDKAMTIANSSTKCNKLRGTVPESGVSLCRIYMTKSNSKADCSQFIDHMKEMNDDPNSAVQFTVTSVSHHKQRPMIKAKLNADAVNTICQSQEIESIRMLKNDF